MTDRRLERLYPALTPKERGILVLRNHKEDRPQDHQLRNSCPEKQGPAFNRYVGMINAASGDLAHVIVILRERAEKEALRFSWLAWAHTCAVEMWGVRACFNLSAREPITKSEYRVRETEARRELIPIEEAAAMITEDFEGWQDADYETTDDGERDVTDEAWYQHRDAKVRELKKLVAEGTLAGKGKGKRMTVECGSLHEWLRQPVPVVPEIGIAFDVRPDSKTREVERERGDYAFIGELLDRGACDLKLPLDMESPLSFESSSGFTEELARVVAVQLRTAVMENWRELRAIARQIDEMSEEFDGEDVLHPRTRTCFDEGKAMLLDLHERLQKYTGPFELPEPDDELEALVKKIVDREIAAV